MSPRPETVEHVIEAIGGLLGPIGRPARPDSRLQADLAFDWLHRISLAAELDQAFGTEISDAEATEWASVEDVALTLEHLTGTSPAVPLSISTGDQHA